MCFMHHQYLPFGNSISFDTRKLIRFDVADGLRASGRKRLGCAVRGWLIAPSAWAAWTAGAREWAERQALDPQERFQPTPCLPGFDPGVEIGFRVDRVQPEISKLRAGARSSHPSKVA